MPKHCLANRRPTSGYPIANLLGECWVEIQQLAVIGSSRSLHSEACNALGASDGVVHSRISQEAVSLRAAANNERSAAQLMWWQTKQSSVELT